MANVSVYNMEGNEVGTLELNDAVFGVEVNEHLVHMAVVAQLANKRQGRPALRFPAAVRSRGDRKEPDMPDRVQPELPSGPAAALFSLRLPETTRSA